MTMNVTSPVTGSAQTGFTSPTYTLVADTPPDINAKQSVVTALGGTQAGVDAHSVSKPFYTSFWRPKTMAVLGKPNPVTGLIATVPNNTYKILTVKGVVPLAGQPNQKVIIRSEIQVPAGSDTADAANIRAALSMHIGSLSQISAGIGDTTINGVL